MTKDDFFEEAYTIVEDLGRNNSILFNAFSKQLEEELELIQSEFKYGDTKSLYAVERTLEYFSLISLSDCIGTLEDTRYFIADLDPRLLYEIRRENEDGIIEGNISYEINFENNHLLKNIKENIEIEELLQKINIEYSIPKLNLYIYLYSTHGKFYTFMAIPADILVCDSKLNKYDRLLYKLPGLKRDYAKILIDEETYIKRNLKKVGLI